MFILSKRLKLFLKRAFIIIALFIFMNNLLFCSVIPNIQTKSIWVSESSILDSTKIDSLIKFSKENNFKKIFKKFLDVKYVWGGKTFNGIDCSALLQIYFAYNNSFYPRDTKKQIKYSKKKLRKKNLKKDISYFGKVMLLYV